MTNPNTETKASPPGEPDDVDLSRLEGYVTPDPIAMLNRQRLRQGYVAVSLAAWSFAIMLTLLAFIFSGSVPLLAVGYAVTVPYLVVCYRYRDVSDQADELVRYCRMDEC